jgi:hypothetical protein
VAIGASAAVFSVVDKGIIHSRSRRARSGASDRRRALQSWPFCFGLSFDRPSPIVALKAL